MMKVKEAANQNISSTQAFWLKLEKIIGKTEPYLYDETSAACRLRRLLEHELKNPTKPREKAKYSPEKQLKFLEQKLSKLKSKTVLDCSGR